MRKITISRAVLCAACCSLPICAQPSSGLLSVQRVGSGFSLPLFATAPPQDTNRLFILEQHTGHIRILKLDIQTPEAEPFLTVTGITRGGEQGLLGLAFHPDYSSNGLFYVNYTTSGGSLAGYTEIARFRAQGDPLTTATADPASKRVLLRFIQPEQNHNGGWIGFGVDGLLYIASGDGGGGNDQHGPIGNGQNRNNLLGKILRIDVDLETQDTLYGIPDGNPFQGIPDRAEEIWAYGLRNPWRCSIDRLTGDLWIGDVGQGAREEINFNPAGVGGLNFGWRPREGSIQNGRYPSETPVTEAVDPVHDYPRTSGVSVVGGYVYRGQAIPSLQGHYLFGDYGSSRFWSLRYDGTNRMDLRERTAELNSGSPRPIRNLSSFGEDAAGELYLCDITDGEIYRIVSAEPPAHLSLVDASLAGDQFQFRFNGQAGQSYVVEWTESLVSPAWQTLTSAAPTDGEPVTVSEPLGSSQRFYRVRQP